MRRVFRTFMVFLLSYILTASAPMLITTLFFYRMVMENITETALTDAQASAAQSIHAIETQLSIVNDIPISLFQNDRIMRWSIENSTLARRDVITEIRQLIGAHEVVYDVFLYLRGSNQFVSGYHSVFGVEALSDASLPGGLFYYDWAYEDMLDTLRSTRYSQVRKAESVRIGTVEYSDAITFIQSIPPNNRYAYAVSLVTVSAKKLSRFIAHAEGMEYALFDLKREYICGSLRDDRQWSEALKKVDERERGAAIAVLAGQETILSWAKSVRQGWLIVETLPLTSVLDNYKNLQRITLALAMALSLFSAVLIFAFMQINYKPIHRLTQMADDVVRDSSQSRNSFEAIRVALDHLKKKNEQLNTDLTDAHPQIRAHALQNLLYARDEDAGVERPPAGAAGLAILEDAASYQVIATAYPDRDALERAYDQLARYDNPSLKAHALRMDYRKEIIILLSSPDSSDDLAGEFLLGCPHAEARIGAGPCVRRIREISDSCAKANTALDYARLRMADGAVMRYDDMPGSAFKARTYPMALMESMSFSIAQGNADALLSQISQVTHVIQSDETPPYLARSLFFSAVNLLIDGMGGEVDDQQTAIIASNAMSMQHSASDMSFILVNLVESFRRIAEKKRMQIINSPAAQALAYIDEQIASADLSLSSAAEYVGLSVSHFSMLFKQEVGCTFKEYVDILRVSRAKQLIRETELLITEIAGRVGYDNGYSFSRLFKKHTGMTPADYRQQSKK